MTIFEVNLVNFLSFGMVKAEKYGYPFGETFEYKSTEYDLYIYPRSDATYMELTRSNQSRTIMLHHVMDRNKIGDLAKEVLDALKKDKKEVKNYE